jgi:hypothetical protein
VGVGADESSGGPGHGYAGDNIGEPRVR